MARFFPVSDEGGVTLGRDVNFGKCDGTGTRRIQVVARAGSSGTY
jgi:hypothetical protein